jgi:putative oxygen-independent coproporphyrinogen III oxidase
MTSRALYIHIPWCIRKCPYCDFNSHKSPDTLPESNYIDVLIEDFKHDLAQFPTQNLTSIFIGGGTPSLFSAKAYEQLFSSLQALVAFDSEFEITLEANPGTFEQERFKAYRQLGINRLSIGIQSFNPTHLKILGRIHDDQQALKAIDTARKAGFDNLNIDLMHSLPDQTLEQGLEDLNTAINLSPEHLSWYQLTIEPNTVFYKTKPALPSETICCDLEEQGLKRLQQADFERYEISAFAKPGKSTKHNENYWTYGDYFGIGAGAHGKLTADDHSIYRTQKPRQPKDYLALDFACRAKLDKVSVEDLIFEFMLNTTRLQAVIPLGLFQLKTGLPINALTPKLKEAEAKGFIQLTETLWQVTSLGRQFTNDLQGMFLPD